MLSDLAIQSLRDRMLLLRSLPSFSVLEDYALALLAEHMRLRACRDGESLLELGEPVKFVYVVLEGRLRWRRQGRKEVVSGRHDVVGWVTLMARDPHGVEAHAVGETRVLELPADALEHALEDDFGIVRNSLRLGGQAMVAARGELPLPPGRVPDLHMGELRPQRRTLVERLIDMREMAFFGGANVEALIAMLRASEDVRIEPGERLWTVGEASDHWYLLDYGRVRCTTARAAQQDIGAFFVLGIWDALAQNPRPYTAEAQTLVIATRIELEAFLGVLEAHFSLARDYIALTANQALDLQAEQREAKV